MDWVIAEIFIVSKRLNICSYPLRILFKEVWASSNVKHPCCLTCLFFFKLAIWKAIIGFTSSGSQEAIFLWCFKHCHIFRYVCNLTQNPHYTLASSVIQIGGHVLMFLASPYCFKLYPFISLVYFWTILTKKFEMWKAKAGNGDWIQM